MKKFLLLLGVLFLGTCVFAITIGVEPPMKFMTSLKNCTQGTFNEKSDGLVLTYTIKGKTPTGRCIVEYSDYTDFSNIETYNNYIKIMKAFGGSRISEADIPTQEQMIAQALREKTTTTCKFSQNERYQLFVAFLRHDGNPTSVTKKPDGTISYSFDSSKMGSYDTLMLKLSQGPCITTSADEPHKNNGSVYACEYADVTCYVTKYADSHWSANCNPNIEGPTPWDTLKKHVNQGMCEKL